jgi:hypothetical protein
MAYAFEPCACTECQYARERDKLLSPASVDDDEELYGDDEPSVPTEHTRAPFHSYDAYVQALKKRGFKYLAGGYYGAVYHKLGSPYVLKIGNCAGDAWPAYAAYCIENPGPFRPVVRSLKWHATGDGWDDQPFYVAVVERLSCTLSEAMEGRYSRAENRSFVRRVYEVVDGGKDIGYQTRRFRQLGMAALADFLRDLDQEFDGVGNDAHVNNWMFRADGALILTDPFSSGSSSSRERRRARERDFQLYLPL